MQTHSILDRTGIRSVNFYTASGAVETCDRCGQGIRNVALVTYKDGSAQRFGCDCIDKVLKQAPDLRKLYNRNAKLLKAYTDALEIFSRSPEQMPRGQEYFQSGLYFIANPKCDDIFGGGRFGHWFFHPLFDEDKNGSGNAYVVTDKAKWQSEKLAEIEKGKAWFTQQISRVEGFLGRILAKVASEQEAR
jgi:hypothetical protein